MQKKILSSVGERPELLILVLIVVIVAMLLIPMPTIMIDVLIAVNIALALLVLIGSFYVDRILNLSSFPSILLITTLFRLALSISTSRLILLNADAGHIVNTFGEYVIGDNLVVGFVIFLIITVVQFIVITKGSERVAEVAARFSLDGMPGKQMSIDADLRSNTIDAKTAQDRRTALERESQLYGSFDGAMKFIKGDAIAGIIIMFVNFIGGISVGIFQHKLAFSDALNLYTILTIGDAMVAQIPALLISISAGFVVTRVSGEGKNLGHSIVTQLFSNQFVILVTAVLVLMIGALPGFPLVVFSVLSLSLGVLYHAKNKKQRKANVSSEISANVSQELGGASTSTGNDISNISIETVPIIFVLSSQNKSTWDKKRFSEIVRERYFLDYGVRLPKPVTRYMEPFDKNKIGIFINEVKSAEIDIMFDAYCVVNYQDELALSDVKLIEGPAKESGRSMWVAESDVVKTRGLGYATRTDVDEFYACFSLLLSRNVTEFFGVQETKNMLDELEAKYPELIRETYRHSSVQKISEVLQRLLGERISVRNIKIILDALTRWAPKERDVITLVEHVRVELARYISNKFSLSDGKIRAVVVSQDIEEIVRGGIKHTSAGTFLNLPPEEINSVMDVVGACLGGISFSHKDLVVLASMDVRRFIKKLLETKYGDIEVLSFGEITSIVQIEVLKTM